MRKIFERIYEEVKKIPKGEVATYGAIAKKAGTTPRVVGFALHKNPDPKNIPCHRSSLKTAVCLRAMFLAESVNKKSC